MKSKVALFSIILTFSLLITALISGCGSGAKNTKGAEYVGAKKCYECHETIYHGWRSTMHPYKFKDATVKAVIGDFTKNNVFKTKAKDGKAYSIKMERKGNKFQITTEEPDGKKYTYKIKYLIGGVWKQRYVTEFPNGALHILPVQWNVKTREWVNYHGRATHKPKSGKYWNDKGRTYQIKCTGCHNTGTKINWNEKTNTYKTTWVDKGVSCEACHGPGSNHIDADTDYKALTIVNPAKIYDPRKAAMACGQCHTRGSAAKDKRFGYPIGYLPGDDLSFLYDEKPGLHPDGSPKKHHQQYIDWVQSGHGDKGVMCWNCHSSHDPGNANRAQLKLPGNALCQSCHIDIQQKGVHSMHSVNNCIGCHMPSTAKTATPFDIKSHRMVVLSPALTLRNPKQPNSCNLCHYHAKQSPAELLRALEKARNKMKL